MSRYKIYKFRGLKETKVRQKLEKQKLNYKGAFGANAS